MHECCKLLKIIFCNAFLLITSVLMDMDVHTHSHSSSGGSGTPFPAALPSFSLGESTTTSSFSNQSVQRERKALIQKVAESVVNFCCLNVNFIQPTTLPEKKKHKWSLNKTKTKSWRTHICLYWKKKKTTQNQWKMDQADMTESAHLIFLIKSRCTWHTQVESRYFSLASALTAKLIHSKWTGRRGPQRWWNSKLGAAWSIEGVPTHGRRWF